MASVKDIDHGWKRIVREVGAMKGSYVKVGVLSDAGSYATGEGSINLADVATFNEFGTSRIPSRPFMAQSFDKNIPQVNKFIAFKQDAIYARKETTAGALENLGIFYQGKVQQEFSSGDFAPNAPSTVEAKESKTPLIDTGRLRNSINHEVVMK